MSAPQPETTLRVENVPPGDAIATRNGGTDAAEATEAQAHAQALESMIDAARGGPMTDRERDRRHRARELQRTAERCFKCDATLGEVWRVRTYIGRNMFGASTLLLPYCGTCAHEKIRYTERRRYYLWAGYEGESSPCESCGRPVYNIESLRCRYVTCGDDCKRPIYADKQRERRDEARGERERECEGCGETFTPKRADARFCSGACRQHAHRVRRATT